MKTNILILSTGVLRLLIPGIWGQRIRLNEPTMEPVPINEDNGIVEDPFLPDEMMVEEGSGATETEQVAVNRTDANPANPPSEQPVPISAILFNGPPGPKDCRGSAILNIGLTKPGARHSSPTCYNVPGVAQCGNFLANKDDGCQARIFNEPDCRTFANLAVFIPEMRAFGGYIRSIEVTCGVISETPPPLNLPGLELPPNALQAAG